jgi:hypothetical protein
LIAEILADFSGLGEKVKEKRVYNEEFHNLYSSLA